MQDETSAIELSEGGLVPVVVQDRLTGEVRMVAFASPEAMRATLEKRLGTFWSRSRGELWEKGQTSGNRLRVTGVGLDCDGDALLYSVDPEGPTCHTGADSCFFREVRSLDPELRAATAKMPAQTAMGRLEATIAERRAGGAAGSSYTKSLLERGPAAIAAKIREEGGELADAVEHESEERVVSEAADVVYHLLVGLAARGVAWRAVLTELEKRSGTSGHAEKAARATADHK